MSLVTQTTVWFGSVTGLLTVQAGDLPANWPDRLPGDWAAMTANWPNWLQWLVGRPLQIVLIIVAAVITVAVIHHVVARLVGRIAKTSQVDERPAGGSAQTSQAEERPAEPGLAARQRLATRAHTARTVLNSVTTVIVWVIAGVLVLERLGVNVAVLVTSLGVAGVGFGLGAQSLIKDWIAGLFMILEDQFGIGDEIDIGPAVGTVVHVSLRVTTLRDQAGALWYIPNGTITRIGNHSQTL
ncbi:MAG: mechanosensitive ion channel family protein [Bifidobacteriaceae bacterium]|nr:mechanosensitive ion channel family protein [Bifidobacteriaceae bacterium]